MSMTQRYASYLERESYKAATQVKAEAMRQAANKLYELDREVDRLLGIENRVEEAISVDVDVVVPTRDYSTMTPKDCYEAGMLDGGTAVREAIRAALTPNAALTGAEGVRVEGIVMQHINDERN